MLSEIEPNIVNSKEYRHMVLCNIHSNSDLVLFLGDKQINSPTQGGCKNA